MCPKIVGSTGGAYDALLGFLVRKLRTSRTCRGFSSYKYGHLNATRSDQGHHHGVDWVENVHFTSAGWYSALDTHYRQPLLSPQAHDHENSAQWYARTSSSSRMRVLNHNCTHIIMHQNTPFETKGQNIFCVCRSSHCFRPKDFPGIKTRKVTSIGLLQFSYE